MSAPDPDLPLRAIPQTPAIRRSFAGLRSVVALMLREMSTRYGRTPGGYIWALMEPVGAIALMAIVFSFLLQAPPLGNSFVLFFATGFLPFVFYANIQGNVMGAIQFSKPLLKYPAVSWFDALLARFCLYVLTGVVVVVIVLTGVVQMTATTAVMDFGPMALALILSALLGFGIGTLNCLLVGLFPVWGQLWTILNRPMFIVAGVLFIFEMVPEGLASNILWYTPWVHLTGLFRSGVYINYQPDYVSIPLILAWALIPLAFGLLLLRRNYQDILMR